MTKKTSQIKSNKKEKSYSFNDILVFTFDENWSSSLDESLCFILKELNSL